MSNLKKFEDFCPQVLQGLVFWVAYKKQYFKSYHFSEGALTSELYTLISAFKPDHFQIIAECHYSRMFPYIKNDALGRKKSVDILLYKKPNAKEKVTNNKKKSQKEKKSKDFEIPKEADLFLLEVKKMESKQSEIIKDFEKIHDYLKTNSKARGFIILLNQDHREKSFEITFEKNKVYQIVDKEGKTNGKEVNSKKFIRGKYINEENEYSYNYSLTAKPARAAKTIAGGKKNALYCILIEVKLEG